MDCVARYCMLMLRLKYLLHKCTAKVPMFYFHFFGERCVFEFISLDHFKTSNYNVSLNCFFYQLGLKNDFKNMDKF